MYVFATSPAFLATVDTREPDPSLLVREDDGLEMNLETTFELLPPFPPDGWLDAVPLGRSVFVLAPTLGRVSLAGSFGFFSGGGLSFSGSELEEDEVEASSGEVLRFLCGRREKGKRRRKQRGKKGERKEEEGEVRGREEKEGERENKGDSRRN